MLLGVGGGTLGSYGYMSAREAAVLERLATCETNVEALTMYIGEVKGEISGRLDREKVDFTGRMDRIDERIISLDSKWFPARPK